MLSVCRAASEAAASAARERADGPVAGRVRPPARPRRARRSPGRPTSSRSCATPGWSTPAAAASCVILDAAETALTGKRPPPVEAGRRIPRPDRGRARRRPGGRRAVVRGDVPPRRRRRDHREAAQHPRRARRLPGRGRRRGAVERARPRRRRGRRHRGRHRGRPAAPGAGDALRRADRRRASRRSGSAGPSSRSPPGRGWPRCSRRPAPWSSTAAPATDPRPGCCSRRWSGRAPTRSSSSPTTTTRCARPRSRPAPRRRTTTSGSR